MRAVSLAALALLAASALSACVFQNLSREEKLRDAVVGYNDECRWGRTDLAAQRVSPEYRDTFRLTHHAWGRHFQIADSEIIHVETAGGEAEEAYSTVTVRWYDQRTMVLAETLLRQRWSKVAGGYILLDEVVIDGNAGLLEAPEAPAEPAEAAEPQQSDEATEAS